MLRKTFNTYPPFQNVIYKIRVDPGQVSRFGAWFGVGWRGGLVEFPEGCLSVLLALDLDEGLGLETGDFFRTSDSDLRTDTALQESLQAWRCLARYEEARAPGKITP